MHTVSVELPADKYLTDKANGTYTFTFAGTVTIQQILIWNYSQNDVRGMDAIASSQVDNSNPANPVIRLTPGVQISRDGGNTWTTIGGEPLCLDPAVDVGFKAQVFNLSGATGVNAICLTGVQGSVGVSGTEFAGGFDEVAFIGTVVP